MKKLFFFYLLIVLFSFSCNKSEGPVEPEPPNNTPIQTVVNFQVKCDSIFQSLLSIKDTASAKDSVLKIFLSNKDVDSALISDQGISVTYKNGMIGGLFINPLDQGVGPVPPALLKILKNKNGHTGYFPAGDIPKSKKTVIVNPHYKDRAVHTQSILEEYIKSFAKVGFDHPDVYLDSVATIDLMTNLSGYGYIHLYSHGYAYPLKEWITEVYLMTGEKQNAATDKKYESDIKKRNIAILTEQGHTKYFISPAFFASKNNLSASESLVYGGFCYSSRGGWVGAMIDRSQAKAYIGFNWSVLTTWNAAWAKTLINQLTNTDYEKPKTLGEWHGDSYPKQYEHEGKVTAINYWGNAKLVLWEENKNIPFKISPDNLKTEINESNSFTAVPSKQISFPYKFVWDFGDGSAPKTSENSKSASHTYKTPGGYTISASLKDMQNNTLSTATAIVEVADTASILPKKFKRISIGVNIMALIRYTYKVNGIITGTTDKEQQWNAPGMAGNLPVTITDSSTFSGSFSSGSEQISVNGKYDPLSKTISLECIYQETVGSDGTISRLSINNLPRISKNDFHFFAAQGSACTYISNIIWENNITDGVNRTEQKLLSYSCPPSMVTAYIQVDFLE